MFLRRCWRPALVPSVVVIAVLTATPAQACDPDRRSRDHHGGAALAAQHDDHAAAAAASTSSAAENTRLLGNVPNSGAISLNFLSYADGRDVMFVTGTFGLKAYDLADPARPRLISQFPLNGMWETENTEVDQARKLVFLARDPRAFGGSTATGESGVYVVDASQPDRLRQASYVKVPAGHTTSCVNRCEYLWTAGPAKASNMPASWGGRPIYVTDMRDPAAPKVFPNPVDLARNDGKTDYTHDVQVDAAGVAWVSGRGGVRGYWTEGSHWDPVRNVQRVATASDPVPYAGGGIAETAAPSRFMHNSHRPVGARSADGGWAHGDLLYVTEESFQSGCAADGVLVIASLTGSDQGQAWRSTPQQPFRLTTVGKFTVAGKEGSSSSTDCSAHYFDVRGNIVVQSFYSQGTRFIDVSDPTNPRQIAYHRPSNTAAWAPYWHNGKIYIADNTRGVDIIELTIATPTPTVSPTASPTASPTVGPTVSPTGDPGTCTGYESNYSGTLSSGASAYQPNNSYFQTTVSGSHRACLDGPSGTDYDLYLQKWNGSAWANVASGTSSTADETLTYNGTAGYYRYRVHAYSGSGSYRLGYDAP